MLNVLEKMEEDICLREMSENTLAIYLGSVKRYLDFLGNRPIEETSEEDIRRYLVYLREVRHLSGATINSNLAAVTFLYEVTLDRNLNKKQVPRAKKAKKLPTILSREELSRLFEVTTNLKHRTILSLGYGSGLRASEVGKLRAEDIDSCKMRVFVRAAKGKKDRYTVLSQTSLLLLREYWKTYRPNHPDGLIFIGQKGESGISKAVCNYAIKTAMEKANIPPGSFHILRRCFATYMLEDGANILVLKELLGHSSLSSTAVYLHLANVSEGIACPIDTDGVL